MRDMYFEGGSISSTLSYMHVFYSAVLLFGASFFLLEHLRALVTLRPPERCNIIFCGRLPPQLVFLFSGNSFLVARRPVSHRARRQPLTGGHMSPALTNTCPGTQDERVRTAESFGSSSVVQVSRGIYNRGWSPTVRWRPWVRSSPQERGV